MVYNRIRNVRHQQRKYIKSISVLWLSFKNRRRHRYVSQLQVLMNVQPWKDNSFREARTYGQMAHGRMRESKEAKRKQKD